MKRTFTTSITQEVDRYVAQCLDIDVACQGETEEEALDNLGEAWALHVTPPVATALPDLRPVEIEISAVASLTVKLSFEPENSGHAVGRGRS